MHTHAHTHTFSHSYMYIYIYIYIYIYTCINVCEGLMKKTLIFINLKYAYNTVKVNRVLFSL